MLCVNVSEVWAHRVEDAGVVEVEEGLYCVAQTSAGSSPVIF